MGSTENDTTLAEVTLEEEEEEEFDLTSWCKDHGITRKTQQTLKKEELTTAGALALLEPRDLRELNIPLGQRKLLQQAVASLNATPAPHDAPGSLRKGDSEPPPADSGATYGGNPGAGTPPANSGAAYGGEPGAGTPPANSGAAYGGEPGAGITIADIRRQAASLGQAGKAFDALFTPEPLVPGNNPLAAGVVNGHSQAPAQPLSFADPRTILTMKAGSSKAVHITDFLSEKTKKRLRSQRRGLVLGLGDNDVVFRDDDEHPYAGISIAEWGASNCRVMAHLIQTGELSRDQVEYYLAYTTQIYEYASSYEWDAIMDFDYIYRIRQACHGFNWGQIPANMELSLVSRPRRQGRHNPNWINNQNNPGSRPPRGQQQANATTKPQECRMFKARGTCNFGAECRFIHPSPAAAKNDQSQTTPTQSARP